VTSLRRLLEADVLEQLDKLVAVSDMASQEWAIEQALADVASYWQGFQLELEPCTAAGCSVVAACCLARALGALEAHQAQVQAMLASQYAGGYEGQLRKLLQHLQEQQVRGRVASVSSVLLAWPDLCSLPCLLPRNPPLTTCHLGTACARFSTAQDVLELLQACQKRWMKLLPALAAPEAAAQAPEVAEQHEAASTSLKGLLDGLAAAATPQEALQALVLPADQRLSQLQACQASLDKVGRLREGCAIVLYAGPSQA
jgi:hypothetical protein